MNTQVVAGDPNAIEVTAHFQLTSGSATSTGVAFTFDFEEWSEQNYVLVPGAMYSGNRFQVYKVAYPPYFYDTKYHRVDLPVTITDVPRLATSGETSKSKAEFLTGNASTPAMCFYNSTTQKGFIVLTEQATRFGNSGMIIEESDDRSKATFVFSAPGVREKKAILIGFVPSNDAGTDWAVNDEVTLRFHVYAFHAENLQGFFDKFFAVRKSLSGQNDFNHHVPFSKALEFETQLQNSTHWNGSYYCNVSGGGIRLGWPGGLAMQTYAMLFIDDPLSRKHVFDTYDVVLSNMLGRSGLLHGVYRNDVARGDNFKDSMAKPNIAMIRRNGDVLYYMLKQFELLKRQGYTADIKPEWEAAVQNMADAFVSLWNKYGQFGQFVDVESGEIEVGGSTAAGIVPAGLALAGRYYNEPTYLEVAKDAAKFYYNRDVKKGYTTGGPGEILQNPDYESAYGMLESFMVLYEVTGEREFLAMAEDTAKLFATWVVSYDYEFPPSSVLGKLQAHSAGAVWASTQNKCPAPGVCTHSASCLLRLYRATGNTAYLSLLKDIAHNILDFMSRSDRPVSSNVDGQIIERVQMSDWEGAATIGCVWDGRSNGWCEAAVMGTCIEIPGVYIRIDSELVYPIDHIEARKIDSDPGEMKVQLTNPTSFDANVSVLAETEKQAKKPLPRIGVYDLPKVHIPAGKSVQLTLSKGGDIISVREITVHFPTKRER